MTIKILGLIIVSLLIVGCSNDSRGDPNGEDIGSARNGWSNDLSAIFVRIERHYIEWEKESDLLQKSGYSEQLTEQETWLWLRKADKQCMERIKRVIGLGYKIRICIFDLWRITGHCEFGDMSSDVLVKNALVLVGRYRNFVRTHGQLTLRQLLRDGIKDNIKLLRTEYCWPALVILQRHIRFGNEYQIAGVVDCIEIPAPNRAMIYDAMNAWFKENNRHLKWNASWKYFDRNGEDFELPAVVQKMMKAR